MKNYKLKNLGKFDELNQYVFAPEGSGIRLEGKVFLGEQVDLTSMEISLNKDKAGAAMSFFHRHKSNEEVYIFIAGKGEMVIDDERFEVNEGTVVSVKPEARRSWRNTGEADLVYIVAQAPVGGLKVAGLQDGEILEDKVPWG